MAIQTPIDPSGTQNNFYGVPLFLGTFVVANLPTTLPANFGTGPIPVGSMANITDGTSVVRGAASTGGGAVNMIVFWSGGTWRN